ncbi:MAG: hypothetical protein DRQ24_11045 [Candidatus Latescibacterota bacterium]|nr:MAG: hypothetical protein DRQ24_11045 [Candidatus Latescibacterota bacterium]
MATTLNGLVYPSHFTVGVMPGDEDGLNYALHRICWWQHLGPGALPTGGDYSSWMSVRGIHTDKRPQDGQYGGLGDWGYDVYGFWINDPDSSPTSLGANSYKTASEWTSTYYITITDPYNQNWDGKYITVLEPPEYEAKVTIVPSKPRFTDAISPTMATKLVKIQDIEKTVLVEAIKDEEALDVIKAAIDSVTEELLPFDPSFSAAFAKTIPGEPLYVEDNNKDYYIVPFNMPIQKVNSQQSIKPLMPKRDTKNNLAERVVDETAKIKQVSNGSILTENTTLIVVILDAEDGHFKEASWVDNPVKYLPVSKEEALKLVFAEMKNIGIPPQLYGDPNIKLVHRDTSLYYPDWKITFDGSQMMFFVDQNRLVDYNIGLRDIPKGHFKLFNNKKTVS